MEKFTVVLFLLLFVGAVSAQTASASDLNEQVVDVDGDGEFVMGRAVENTFTYRINNPYQPIDTALAIDDSGSMDTSNLVGPAKDAAKTYVEETNINKGDKNGVVFFESSATTEQSLTSSKSSAKNAINGLTGDGGTNLPGGVSEARSVLNSGDNPVQVMIVLGDGDGGDPKSEADSARADGIEVHGIMFGGGADSGEFESLTGADACSTSSFENDDGDNCWYAEQDTVTSVYSAIQEEVTAETEADLNVVLPDHAVPITTYDSSTDVGGGYTRYRINDVNSSAGTHSKSFRWYPGEEGPADVKTAESYLSLNVEGSTKTYYFDDSRSEDVKYVDLNISDVTVERVEDSVDLDLTLRNKGDISSKERYLSISDEDGNYINRTIPPISSGGSYEENFSVGGNHNVFQDADRISAHFDFQGVFDSLPVGEGQILEPDEGNNKKSLGYPVALESTSPDDVQWNDTFQFSLDFDHYFADVVQGTYDLYVDGNLVREDAQYNKPAEGTLRTDPIKNDDSRIWYNITSEVIGPYGARSVFEHSYYVRNPRPEIYASEPKNLNSVYEKPVRLRAYVDDENNVENPDDLDVRVYNQDTGQLLTEETGVPPRSSVTYDWPDADQPGKVYRWNVTVSDRWHTISEVFRFRKSTRNSYRAETQSDYSYSAVVTSAGSPGNFEYSVNNPLDFDKNSMETSLSGVNANFADGSDSKSYSLPSESSKTFDIVVSPDQTSTGQQYITVTTENLNLGIKNTDRIPVYVREDAKRSYDVPGLGLIQLLVIMLSSMALFYRKV